MSRKAVIYARVSTEKQSDGYSLSTQIEACKAYADELGFEVIEVYEELLSGGTLDRPELNKAMQRAGEAQALICYVHDRFARTNELDALFLIHTLNQRGMDVYLAYERKKLNTGDFTGQIETLIRAKVAREEREKITERMMRGKRGKMQSGRIVAPTAPFGYDKTDDSYLEVNEEQARTVRQIFNWYVFGDENGRRMGLGRIAKRLTHESVASPADIRGYGRKTRRKGSWGVGSVSYILKNKTYKGIWTGGKPPIEVPVPVIIDDELWEAAQKQGKKNRRNAKRNTKQNYLLRNVMICLDCGYRFHGLTHGTTGKMYYRCGGQHFNNSEDYNGFVCRNYLIGETVDNIIWRHLAQILKDPDLILAEFEKRRESEQENTQQVQDYIKYCEKQVNDFENQREKLLELYLNDKLPQSLLEEKSVEIEQQIDSHKQRLTELNERLRELTTLPENYEQLVRDFCEAVQKGIDNFLDEDKRTVIETLDIHVFVKRGETRDDDTFELTGFIPNVSIDSSSSRKNGKTKHLLQGYTVMKLKQPSPI